MYFSSFPEKKVFNDTFVVDNKLIKNVSNLLHHATGVARQHWETFWYNHDFDLAPYQNDKVIIRFGHLIPKEGARGGKQKKRAKTNGKEP